MSDYGGGDDDAEEVTFGGGGIVLGDGDNDDGEFVNDTGEEEGYCERLGNSLGCVIVGIVLFLGMFPLLFWNEGRAVQTYNTLKEGEAITISINDPSIVDPMNNGKLVHISDMLQISSSSSGSSSTNTLVDPIFGVSVNNNDLQQQMSTTAAVAATGTTNTTTATTAPNSATTSTTTTVAPAAVTTTTTMNGYKEDILKLQRSVQMYQWKESKTTKTKKSGGTTQSETVYNYDRVWESYVIDSGKFRDASTHRNPNTLPYRTQTFVPSSGISLGPVYEVPAQFVDNSINWYTPIDSTYINKNNIIDNKLKSSSSATSDKVIEYNNGYYISTTNSAPNPSYPQVGDIRITFSVVVADEATIVAQQVSDTGKLTSFTSKYGGTVFIFKRGYYTIAQIYEQERDANQALTWGLRFIGYILMGLGIYLCLYPLEVLVDVIPCLGELVACGIMLVACPIATFFAGITISIAWLIYHPVIGIVVIIIICAVSGGLMYILNLNKKPTANKNGGGNKGGETDNDNSGNGNGNGNGASPSTEQDELAAAEAAAAQAYG